MKRMVLLSAVLLSALSTTQARQLARVSLPQQHFDVSAFALETLDLPALGWAPFQTRIRLGDNTYEVSFTPHSVRGPDFRVLVQDASGELNPFPPPPEFTYSGTIEGVPEAVIAGTLVGGKLSALIRLGSEPGQTWVIQPLSEAVPGAPMTAHVVSNDKNMIRRDWTCGVKDNPIGHDRSHDHGGPDAFLACQMACDTDFEFFVANGSNVTATTTDISTVINGVAAIYQADTNVTFQLGTVIVRQSATQPYTSSDSSALLTQFRNEWNANQTTTVRDLAHLFTGKDLDGSIIGLASLGVVCNATFGYGLSQSRFTLNLAGRFALTAHEVGHNFNAGHCDGVCTPCTIMCSGLGGCSGTYANFGCSASGVAIYAQGRICLSQFNNGLATPFFDSFTSTTLDYNRWPTPANAGGVVNTNAVLEHTAPNSLNVSGTNSITSAGIDLTGVGAHRVFVSFWSEHRGVESPKTLAVAYRRPVQGDFQPLITLTSNGTDQNKFVVTEIVLPTAGHGANAAIRFTGVGTQADDNWYIDDVKVSPYCRADVNQDWKLNILDFVAYQGSWAAQNLAVADWDGDGFISTLDFSAYLASFTAGCTGY